MWLAWHEDGRGQQPAKHTPRQQQQRVAAPLRGARHQSLAGEQQGGGQGSQHHMDGLSPLVHHCRRQELQQGGRRGGSQAGQAVKQREK